MGLARRVVLAGLVLGAGACRHAEVTIPSIPESKTPAAPSAPAPATEEEADFARIGEETIRVRLLTGVRQAALGCTGPMVATGEGVRQQWAAGTLTAVLSGGTPAPRRFHLFVKTFPMDQAAAAQSYVDAWKQRGYPARIIPLGKRFRTNGGQYLDNRLQYISLTQVASRAQAMAEKTRLESQGQWSWIEEEAVSPGGGSLVVGARTYPTPLEVQGTGPISVTVPGRKPGTYSGMLTFQVGADGLLEVYETLPLEDYLMGVLPAEMPASWPAEALKAQAVAARSEVLANFGVKHKLEGFAYCAAEHCRAYGGFGSRRPTTDAAVASTEGLVLSNGVRVVPTVFSACCGGWSENNENVWSSPPDAALRGVADFPEGSSPAPAGPVRYGLTQWLSHPPAALCAADSANYRWSRRYSAAELTRLVNKKHAVGVVRDVRLGERGVSGRLKSVEIIGSKGTVTVKKELAIRETFGSLPSAMFILDVERGAKGPVGFVFRGGGRGHGVGLCQQGARGLAARGGQCAGILNHYFSGTVTVGLE